MMKRMLSFILCLAAVLSIVAVPSFGEGESELNIPDKSMTYDLYTKKVGMVRSLSTGKEAPFDYEVPDGGVALIAFFTGNGTNVPSGKFFEELTEESWISNSKINFYAVECSGASAETTRGFMKEHDKNKAVKNIYYLSPETTVHTWYLTLIAKKGEMENVNRLEGAYGAVFLLVVTKENGVKQIRYALSGQRSTKYLQNYINKFTNTGVESVPLITLTAYGSLHFEYVQPVLDLVNKQRKDAGVGTLTLSSELTNLSMIRAIETSVYWSHTRPDGTSCFTITINGKGYSGSLRAENIAAVHSSPEKVMEYLMNSEGHKKNILTREFTQIGVGCYETAGVYYWVQLFGIGDETKPVKCSLFPNEVPFQRVLENVEYPVSAYKDLVGEVSLMFGDELSQTQSTAIAGEKTDISLPFVYVRSIFDNNTLISAFEPYITSYDENGKSFVVPPTGKTDTELGITVVPDRSIYTPRPASGTIFIFPYEGSRQSYTLPLTVVVGEDGLPDDPYDPFDDSDDPVGPGNLGDDALLGDVNGDGAVNAKDVTTLMKVLIGITPKNYVELASDINNDGKRNAKDVTALMKRLVG